MTAIQIVTAIEGLLAVAESLNVVLQEQDATDEEVAEATDRRRAASARFLELAQRLDMAESARPHRSLFGVDGGASRVTTDP